MHFIIFTTFCVEYTKPVSIYILWCGFCQEISLFLPRIYYFPFSFYFVETIFIGKRTDFDKYTVFKLVKNTKLSFI